MQGYIYQATSPSGKSYIGQTINTIVNRWRDHVYDAITPYKDQCKLLNRAIRKYGINSFELKCLEICDRKDLDEKEAYYIALHKTMKPDGYNLKAGGSSNGHSEETKKKISETMKQKFKNPEYKADILNRRKIAQENGLVIPEKSAFVKPKSEIVNQSDKPKEKKTKRRIFNELPKYIVRIRTKGELHGYSVQGHPNQNGLKKQFASRQVSLEENLELSIAYINHLDSLEVPMQRTERTLPKYLQKWKWGYYVKCPSPEGKKFFLSTKKTNEELYEDAVNYLNQLMSATYRDQGNP